MSEKERAYNALIDSYLVQEVDQQIVFDLRQDVLPKFGIVLHKKGLGQATNKR